MNIEKYSNLTLREALIELIDVYGANYLTSYFIFGLDKEENPTNEQFQTAISNISKLTNSLIELPYKNSDYVIGMDVYANRLENSKLVSDSYFKAPNDNNKYALDFVDWEDIIDARIDLNSIAQHGLLNVVVTTLIKLSFYGYDYDSAMKGFQETKNYLDTLQ